MNYAPGSRNLTRRHFLGAEPWVPSLNKEARGRQNRRLGRVRPCSQFLTVAMLTPSSAANWSRDSLRRKRAALSKLPHDFPAKQGGFESHLTDWITRWQKGFRKASLRHFFNAPLHFRSKTRGGSVDAMNNTLLILRNTVSAGNTILYERNIVVVSDRYGDRVSTLSVACAGDRAL